MTFRSILLTLAVLAAFAAPAAAVAPAPVTLEEGWEFKRDPHDRGLKGGWIDGNWEEAWQGVQVPHVFDPEPTDNLYGGTIGWYRLRFDAPETPGGFSWDLRFEGARRVTRVWLNGKRIGVNSNPYQPFTLPASGLREGSNDLVVRVHNIKPLTIREGWWNWGGIVRPVHLEPRAPAQWEDVGLLPDVACPAGVCRAGVTADGWLVNRSKTVLEPLLTVHLKSPDGVVSEKTVKARALKPGERRRIDFRMKINGRPGLWSPKHPNLYTGYVEVKDGAEVYQHDERRTGLRQIRVRGGMLFLNGHRLQVRGASIQEDLPGRGPALRQEDIEQIVSDLKALKANVTRAQYPLNEHLLSRFDEEGILVWSQAPVYHEDDALATLPGRGLAYRKVNGTILYARNHPSVMTHSVANELTTRADDKPGTRLFLIRSAAMARSLDRTVPISLDLLSYPRIPKQQVYDHFDLLGINSYYGWYKGNAGSRSTAKFSGLLPYLRAMHRKYPRHAMMITEFGAEATYDGPANVKETYAFQSRYLRKTLNVVDRLRWMSGAIYWTAREFYVKPNWDGGAERTDVVRDAIHNKGLIHYDGTPKPAFDVARKRFATTPIFGATPARKKKR
jgi:beta-galactosidase/beta-glucuronidase